MISRRKLPWNSLTNLHGCGHWYSACACVPCLKKFTEKTFVALYKSAKFVKVFSLKSFPLYGMSCMGIRTVKMGRTLLSCYYVDVITFPSPVVDISMTYQPNCSVDEIGLKPPSRWPSSHSMQMHETLGTTTGALFANGTVTNPHLSQLLSSQSCHLFCWSSQQLEQCWSPGTASPSLQRGRGGGGGGERQIKHAHMPFSSGLCKLRTWSSARSAFSLEQYLCIFSWWITSLALEYYKCSAWNTMWMCDLGTIHTCSKKPYTGDSFCKLILRL